MVIELLSFMVLIKLKEFMLILQELKIMAHGIQTQLQPQRAAQTIPEVLVEMVLKFLLIGIMLIRRWVVINIMDCIEVLMEVQIGHILEQPGLLITALVMVHLLVESLVLIKILMWHM